MIIQTMQNEKKCTEKCGMGSLSETGDPILFLFLARGDWMMHNNTKRTAKLTRI